MVWKQLQDALSGTPAELFVPNKHTPEYSLPRSRF